MTGEMIRFIREEIRKQMSVLLFGAAGSNQSDRETINSMYPGMASITDRPIMHPYGVSSRAPEGTISVVGKAGEHTGNRMTLGHMDRNRPDPGSGGTIIYASDGSSILSQVKLSSSGVRIEKGEDELIQSIIDLVDAILAARTNTLLGPQPLVPQTGFNSVKSTLQSIQGDP